MVSTLASTQKQKGVQGRIRIRLIIIPLDDVVDMNGCGGSLIAPGVVLSATHCGDYDGNDVIVGGYEHGETGNGAVSRKVAETKFNPNYNSITDANDFMLLRLETPVTMDNFGLVLNDKSGVPDDGQDLTVLGLGDLEEDGNGAKFLQDVVVEAVDTGDCNWTTTLCVVRVRLFLDDC
jgi:secreted trypsin-like serine protease